jgi:uncharacterized membrane-anchored protein
VLAAIIAVASFGVAQATPDPDAEQADESIIRSLHPQSGVIPIEKASATLRLSPGYLFLSAQDAQRVLSELWSNPPDEDVLGMIVPGSDVHVLLDNAAWAVVVTYVDDGYVSDADAAKTDYDAMLKSMQENTRDSNAQRVKRGYPAVELVGWAEPPHYDDTTHKIYWARNLMFKDTHGETHTLNYDVRVLGRRGYLALNAVASLSDLDKVRADMPRVLAMADFDQGERYADYNANTDKLAAYGIAALVAGGLAAKAGLFAKIGVLLLAMKNFIAIGFAKIGVLLLAMKKFIAIGLVALAGIIKKFFWRKKT